MNPIALGLGSRVGSLVAAVSLVRHGLIGMALARIGFGCLILSDLAIHAGSRQDLWGPESWYGPGQMARDQRTGMSLFAISTSAGFTDLLYAAYALVALLFLIGWRTAFVTPVLFVLTWSFQERNPYLINGGDNLLRIILFYLMFAQLNAWLAPGAVRRRMAARDVVGSLKSRAILRTVAHNAALAACIGQLVFMYTASALFKVQGEMWQEGTAVYYITRVAEYDAWPELSRLLNQSGLAVTVATYAAVFTQLSFGFCLLNRWSRHAVFVMLCGMHTGIGLLMGLPVFSGIMIVTDLLVFTDSEWLAGGRRLVAWRPGQAAIHGLKKSIPSWTAARRQQQAEDVRP